MISSPAALARVSEPRALVGSARGRLGRLPDGPWRDALSMLSEFVLDRRLVAFLSHSERRFAPMSVVQSRSHAGSNPCWHSRGCDHRPGNGMNQTEGTTSLQRGGRPRAGDRRRGAGARLRRPRLAGRRRPRWFGSGASGPVAVIDGTRVASTVTYPAVPGMSLAERIGVEKPAASVAGAVQARRHPLRLLRHARLDREASRRALPSRQPQLRRRSQGRADGRGVREDRGGWRPT